MNEASNSLTLTLVVYCTLILFASLAGGWIPMLLRLTHTRLQVATSFVAGLMLGVGLLHMLPHAWHELQSIDRAVAWLTVGFLTMFFIQRFFHFHHHDVPDEDPEGCTGHHPACPGTHPEPSPQPGNEETAGAVHHDHTLAGKSAQQLSWSGAAFGLTLHTLIAGMALAASATAAYQAGSTAWLGIGTFLVIFLHKPFDAMVISTLMTIGGWSRGMRHLVNALFALVVPVGVAFFFLGASQMPEDLHHWIGGALAFASGTFLCIAASDLLPELQFHSHDRGKLSLALLAGLGLAVLIGQFESSGHDHHQPPPAHEESAEHGHDHP